MRTPWIGAIWLVAGAGLAACSQYPNAASVCPEDATHAVLWSSEYSDARLQLFRKTTLLWETHIPARGFSPSRGLELVEDEYVAVAAGHHGYKEPKVVRFEATQCQVTTAPIDAQAVYSWTTSPIGVYTMETVNDVAKVSRYTLDGANVASVSFAGEGTNGAGVSDEGLLLFTDQISDWQGGVGIPERFIARLLDLETLDELWSTEVPTQPPGWQNPVLVDDKAIFAVGYDNVRNQETDDLYELDLNTKDIQQHDLSALAPYWLTQDPSAKDREIFITHSAMNPGVRPLSEYREVTRLELPTFKASTLQLQRGVSQISVSGETLLAYGEHSEGGVHVDAYFWSDGQLRFQQDLRVPSGMETGYVAGVIALR